MENFEYKIEDNYLPLGEYQKIKEFIGSMDFNWNWAPYQLPDSKDTFHFTHVFYDYNQVIDQNINILNPLFKKIGFNVLITCKVNLNPLTVNGWSGVHTDAVTDTMIHDTSIFYLGTNDGVTILHTDDGEIEIESVDNRMVTFDSNIKHSVRHQTNKDRRIVININHVLI